MKQGGIFVVVISLMLGALSPAKAAISLAMQPSPSTPLMLSLSADRSQGFMTSRDPLNATSSGITLKNVSNSTLALTGLYIQTLNSGGGAFGTNYGQAFGALWSAVSLTPASTTSVGANFLYNMLMNYTTQFRLSNRSDETPPTPGAGSPWLMYLGVTQGSPVTLTSDIDASNNLVYISSSGELVSYAQQFCVACSDSTQTCEMVMTAAFCSGLTSSSTQQDVPCTETVNTNCATGISPP